MFDVPCHLCAGLMNAVTLAKYYKFWTGVSEASISMKQQVDESRQLRLVTWENIWQWGMASGNHRKTMNPCC